MTRVTADLLAAVQALRRPFVLKVQAALAHWRSRAINNRTARTCEWHIDCTTKLNGAHLSQYKPHAASIPTLSYPQNQYSQPNPLALSHPLSNAPTTSSGSGPFSRPTRLLSKCATLLAPIKTALPSSSPSRL